MTALPGPVHGHHDHLDAELVCAAQILWRDQLINDININALNQRIGRAPGSVDIERGAWRLLFDHGYTRLAVAPIPDLDQVRSYDQWVAELAALGTDISDTAQLRDVYPMVADMQAHLLRLRAQAGGRWRHEHRHPTAGDADRLIDDGWSLMVHLGGEGGWSYRGVVVGRDGSGYLAYVPDEGMVVCGPDVFEQGGVRALEAWRREVGLAGA